VVRMNENVMARYLSEYRQEEEFANLDERELRELIIDNHTREITPDEAMNAPTSIEQVNQEVFGGEQCIR